MPSSAAALSLNPKHADWSSELSLTPTNAVQTKDRRTLRRADSIRKMHAKSMQKRLSKTKSAPSMRRLTRRASTD